MFLGIDEYNNPVSFRFVERSLLIGGQPGSGKSGLLNNIVGHYSQCPDVRLVLIDGKQVELGLWQPIADIFVGPDQLQAIAVLKLLQAEMNDRYDWLTAARRRKLTKHDDREMIVVVIDEIALFTATFGDKDTQEEVLVLLRDLVARGRAAGIVIVAATQRPSADVIKTSLRDIFSYRCAFRCTTEASSDIILGTGWADRGYDASQIGTENVGVGYFLAEESRPFRFRSAWLDDLDIDTLVTRGLSIRAPLFD